MKENKARFKKLKFKKSKLNYILISYAFSITLGFIFNFYFVTEGNFDYNIISSLLGWTFGFFTLSISIYALILRFTRSTTISVYIQEEVKMIFNATVFCLIYIIELYLLVHFTSYNITMSYFTQLMLFIIPLMLLILMILIQMIFPLLRATTTKNSLFFFEKRVKRVRKAFDKKYNKSLKTAKLEFEKTEKKMGVLIKDGKVKESDPNYRLFKYYQDSLSPVKLSSTAKIINQHFKDLNKDALNIMFEIKDTSRYADPAIFRTLGRLAVPPYMNDEYIRDNLIIKLNLAVEEDIEYDSCLLDFLEGYILEAFNSPYLNGIMAYSLENLLGVIDQIGYGELETKRDTNLFDKTNKLFQKFGKSIEILIKNKHYDPGDPIQRMIEKIGRIISSYLTQNPTIQGVQLYHITELIKLDINLQLKQRLFNFVKDIMNRLKDIQYHGPNIFSDFQEIFPAILNIKDLENPQYDPSKIKDHHITYRNGKKVYKGNSVFYIIKYNSNLARWLGETIDFLFKLYNRYLAEKEKKPELIDFNPYLQQMNRIFIDLTWYLCSLKSTDKFDAAVFCKRIFNDLYSKLIEIGETLLKKEDNPKKYINLLALSIVFGDIIFQKQRNDENIKIFSDNINKDFGLLTLLGIIIINKNFHGEEIVSIDKNLLIDKVDLIKKTFLRKGEVLIDHYIDNDFISSSIETRQGSWGIPVGYQIGRYILEISNIFNSGQLIVQLISDLKREKKITQPNNNSSDKSHSYEEQKSRDTIDERDFKELLKLLPASKEKIRKQGLINVFDILREQNRIYYNKSDRKWEFKRKNS
ncbi:MAG: hypothetical protein ACW96X_05810 [Promethearchaeota archaeon]|jgi:hypothetical protein